MATSALKQPEKPSAPPPAATAPPPRPTPVHRLALVTGGDKKPKKATVAAIKRAIRENDGLLAQSARAIGMSRQALYERIEKSKDLQGFLVQLKEDMHDGVEGVISQAIFDDKDLPTTRWYADRQMRHRGYGNFVATKDETPVDPQAEMRRAALVAHVFQAIEDRMVARLKGEAAPARLIDVTPKRK